MTKNIILFSLLISFYGLACKSSNKNFKETSFSLQDTNRRPQESIIIAFGSCNDEDRPQPLWNHLNKEHADIFLWLGDNIYGDSEDPLVLKHKYEIQNSNKDYQNFKKNTPINGTWDDHDYGVNDGGKEFRSKVESQQLLLDFLEIPKDHIRRTRAGVYDKISISKNDILVDIFILDTRYFRDTLIGKRGEFSGMSKGTILGNAQWNWLDECLASSKADVHIFLSSIQLIPEEHGWEKWYNFPKEKEKFLKLIEKYQIQYPIVLSGDRHSAEISEQKLNETKIYDITSSSLTHGIRNPRPEANRFRTINTELIFEENYGILEIQKAQGLKFKAMIKTSFEEIPIQVNLFEH